MKIKTVTELQSALEAVRSTFETIKGNNKEAGQSVLSRLFTEVLNKATKDVIKDFALAEHIDAEEIDFHYISCSATYYRKIKKSMMIEILSWRLALRITRASEPVKAISPEKQAREAVRATIEATAHDGDITAKAFLDGKISKSMLLEIIQRPENQSEHSYFLWSLAFRFKVNTGYYDRKAGEYKQYNRSELATVISDYISNMICEVKPLLNDERCNTGKFTVKQAIRALSAIRASDMEEVKKAFRQILKRCTVYAVIAIADEEDLNTGYFNRGLDRTEPNVNDKSLYIGSLCNELIAIYESILTNRRYKHIGVCGEIQKAWQRQLS